MLKVLLNANQSINYSQCGVFSGKCLHLSGLTSEQMSAYDDFKLKDIGIGFTNIVERTSRSSADLSRSDLTSGGRKNLFHVGITLQKYEW